MDAICNTKLVDVLMKKLKILTIWMCVAVLSMSCTGYKYQTMSALEFQDIDYTFETKQTNGPISMAYIEEGTDSEVLILIHGLASNAGFWRYVIPELSSEYRVIAVDLPGYGKSDKGDFEYGMKFYADQIIALMDELEIEKANIAGHSMGGQIAITFALNYANRLDKLVLVSPAGVESFKPGEADWLRNVFRIDDLVNTSEEAVRVNLNRNFYEWSSDYEWMVEERVRMARGKDMREFSYAVIQCVGAMLDEPTSERLSEIESETLIIHGQNDGLIPNPFLHPGFTWKVFEKGVQQMPNATRVEIPKTGHLLQIESPDAFNRALLEFLD